MKQAIEAIAATIKAAPVDNDAKVAMAKTFYASFTLAERSRLKREDFLGACGCYRLRNNLMSGNEIKVAYGTPISCDPSSETYWSM